MSADNLKRLLPDCADDLRLNLDSVLRQPEISSQQLWSVIVSCAMACRSPVLVRELLSDACSHLTPVALRAAQSAAAVMGMSNIFHRFAHLTANPNYRGMPMRLRSNVVRRHGSSPIDFELCCLAVSSINGCGACVDHHETLLRRRGVTEQTILAAVRVAAVLHAIATVLEAETDMQYQPVHPHEGENKEK